VGLTRTWPPEPSPNPRKTDGIAQSAVASDYHEIIADFIPPPGAVWREGRTWSPGLIIAHNDATTHAAWHQGKLTVFFDWDFAGAPVGSAGSWTLTAGPQLPGSFWMRSRPA